MPKSVSNSKDFTSKIRSNTISSLNLDTNNLKSSSFNSSTIFTSFLHSHYTINYGQFIFSNSETIEGDGSGKDVISINNVLTYLDTSSGTSDLTLADGVNGQIKIVTMITAGNNAVLDSVDANLQSSITTITWDAVGESVIFLFNGTDWVILGQYGVTIA